MAQDDSGTTQTVHASPSNLYKPYCRTKVFADISEHEKQIEILHEILDKLGMKRPYTMEQARQVKGSRELQRELGMVQIIVHFIIFTTGSCCPGV